MKWIFLALFLATSVCMTVILPADAAAPVGSFVSATTSGAAPFSVQFIDSSSNSPTSWSWSFGDGDTSADQNPSHIYTSAGSYAVTLTVTNADGSDTISKNGYITVSDTVTAPAAAFVASVTSGNAPLVIQFADSSTNSPSSWVWSFGDGDTATTQNPSHTYTSAGSYTVTLTATNDGGSSTVSKAAYITASAAATAPVASFVTATTSGTIPFTVQFADSSSNSPTSWVWSFGDGDTATTQNPSHTYTSAGSYTVTLTATNSAGSNTVSQAAYITASEAKPVASFSANVTSGTAPMTVQFTDTSTNSPTSWLWVFGDGESSTDEHPEHEYEEAGTYTVTLTTTNSAGSNITYISGFITVSAASNPVTSFTADTRTGTAPMTVRFTDTSTNSPTSWLWSFGDGSSSTEQNPSHTYTYAGTFTVSLTAYNSAGSRTSSVSDYIVTKSVTTTPDITVAPPVPVATTLPVTTQTTAPIRVAVESTMLAETAASQETGSGTMDLLVPAGVVALISGIGVLLYLKRRRDRNNYWDL